MPLNRKGDCSNVEMNARTPQYTERTQQYNERG